MPLCRRTTSRSTQSNSRRNLNKMASRVLMNALWMDPKNREKESQSALRTHTTALSRCAALKHWRRCNALLFSDAPEPPAAFEIAATSARHIDKGERVLAWIRNRWQPRRFFDRKSMSTKLGTDHPSSTVITIFRLYRCSPDAQARLKVQITRTPANRVAVQRNVLPANFVPPCNPSTFKNKPCSFTQTQLRRLASANHLRASFVYYIEESEMCNVCKCKLTAHSE